MTDEQKEELIPKQDYDDLLAQLADFQKTADQIIEENKQLKDVLKQMDLGITKASEMAEGMAHTNDQKLITELAFSLLHKHHPTSINIKYRGETLLEINPE